MAKHENVELFKTGVTGWNEFRKEHQEVSPDLRARAKTTSDFSASSPSPREERTGRGPGRGAPTKMFELRPRLGTCFCTDPYHIPLRWPRLPRYSADAPSRQKDSLFPPRPHRRYREVSAGQLGQRLEIGTRFGRQVLPLACIVRRRAPAGKLSVNRLAAR